MGKTEKEGWSSWLQFSIFLSCFAFLFLVGYGCSHVEILKLIYRAADAVREQQDVPLRPSDRVWLVLVSCPGRRHGEL